MKLSKILITFVLTVTSLSFAGEAKAWGILGYASTNWKKATLVQVVKNTGKIRYCVQMAADSPFDPESISIQTEMALRLWLSPFAVYQDLPIERSACDQSTNLVVSFDHYPADVLSDQRLMETDHAYSFVRVNLDYTFTYSGNDYHWQDISKFFTSGLSGLGSELQGLAEQKDSIDSFATAHGIDITEAYLVTYKNFLHEFGHSFGLCDTYSPGIQFCDPQFSSKEQVSSIMRDSAYFYLTDDDLEGIHQLFLNY